MRIAAAALFSSALAFPWLQDPAAAEPPLRLELQIDGAKHALIDGQEVQIELGGKPTKVKVVVAPTRRFAAAGVAFEFPRDMAFGHEEEDALEMWTLDGDSVVVHVHRHDVPDAAMMASATMSSMMEMIDPNAAKAVKWQVDLGGAKHDGLHGKLEVVDGLASLEMFAVGLKVGTGSVVLIVQHSVEDDTPGKDEVKRVLDLLAKTFTVTAK